MIVAHESTIFVVYSCHHLVRHITLGGTNLVFSVVLHKLDFKLETI